MYNIQNLQDRYPDDYVINLDLLGNGYKNTIYVSFLPPDLDKVITSKNKKRICKLAKQYFNNNGLAKDVYNKIMCLYGG